MERVSIPRTHLRWGFIGFLIAAVGVAVALSAPLFGSSVVGPVGFGITVAGVALGFVAVILGFARVVAHWFAPSHRAASKDGPAA